MTGSTRLPPPALAGWLLLWATLCAALPARAEDDARDWLAQMNEALAARSYAGEFLHLANGRVEQMRILHRSSGGRVAERLVSLSGSGREIVRNETEIHCYLPDQRKVLVESRDDRAGPLLGTLPPFDAGLDANYRLEMLGRSRSVLGRPARVVAIVPRDAYRFGYRLWIDEASRMPVRTDLVDAQGHVLEQVLFTALEMGADVPDAALKPAVRAEGYAWVRQGRGALSANEPVAWRAGRLPPGFRHRSSRLQLLPGGERPATHIVVSDGLATVSVFVEGPVPGRAATEGQGRVGAAFAYTRVVDGHQVTAVGEVPPQTVRYIAAGIEPTGPGPASNPTPSPPAGPPR
jgi:sigma-E factor negative regulatory protein RseB